MAEIIVDKNYDTVYIAELAGQHNIQLLMVEPIDETDVKLIVQGIDQSALDTALDVYIPQHETHILAKVQAGAIAAIDEEAGKTRKRHAPEVFGQVQVWQEKYAEAADYASRGYPIDDSGYPFLLAEVAATSKSTTECANDIIAKRNALVSKMAEIEEVRRGGKIAVDNALTANAVITIMNNTIAGLQGL